MTFIVFDTLVSISGGVYCLRNLGAEYVKNNMRQLLVAALGAAREPSRRRGKP